MTSLSPSTAFAEMGKWSVYPRREVTCSDMFSILLSGQATALYNGSFSNSAQSLGVCDRVANASALCGTGRWYV